ncbi:MAG TPA: YncE family protein [Terriglobales bacterium]|jgi:DNA-binding beta-propeller fold protein YncE
MTKFHLAGLCLGLAAAAGFAVVPALAQGSARPDGYHVTKSVSLPNNGGWDYLGIDAPAHKLYVSASDQEDVVDTRSFKLIGTVSGLKGTHGVAVSDKDGHGFTSNGGDNSSTEFDLKTLATIKNIPLPIQRPDGIIYDPASDRVFIFNHDSQAVAINAADGTVAGTVTLPSKAAEFAVADGRGHVFDNLEDSSQEIEIDAQSLQVINTWKLAPCEGPSGLAMDAETHRLFVGCHNGMMAIVNADDGSVVATVPIGQGVDATRFDPATKLAFSSNGGSATITVIHEDSPDKYTVVGNIPTEAGARTMEFDPNTNNLFTVTAKTKPAAPAARGAAPAAGGREGRGRGRGFAFPQRVPGSFHLLVISK